MGAFNTFKSSDELFTSMEDILKQAGAFIPDAPEVQAAKTKAIEMLDWIVKSSPVAYGKREAATIKAFLVAPNSVNLTAAEIDRVAANLCLYRSERGLPLNHNLLVQDIDELMKALGSYKDNFAKIVPEETITRWESAVQSVKAGKSNSYDPDLKEALMQTVQAERGPSQLGQKTQVA